MNNIVFSTTLIAISILGGFLYILPEYRALSSERESRSEYIDTIETINEVQEKFVEARDWRSSIRQSDLDRIDIVIPAEFNNVEFLLDLENISVANGITLDGVAITKQANTGSYTEYGISFGFDAPYDGAAENFMKALENSLTLFDVTSLEMQSGEDGLISYSLSFNTYAQR